MLHGGTLQKGKRGIASLKTTGGGSLNITLHIQFFPL
jgi:hypothetical protein